jgi:hypothetical protein
MTTKAQRMPKRSRGGFLGRQRRNDQPCEYGHFGCSDTEGGACSDELLGIIETEHEAAWQTHHERDPHCSCNDCLDRHERQMR